MEIKLKKSLGQNFLINTGVLGKIVSAAELASNDTVLEIGPGTGNLTKLLSEKAGRVVAIEKDRRLIGELQEKFKNTNVEIVEGDALLIEIDNLLQGQPLQGAPLQYKVIGNIPYYITSNLLRTIFEKWPKPKLIVLTVQKEVAQRIMAKPPDMNLLALSVQLYSEPKIIGYISKGSFRPMPKVDSAIIKLTPKSPTLNPEEKEMLFKLLKAGFSEKRKQLVNNLAKNFGMMKEDLMEIFQRADLKHDIRAENLSLKQWVELSKFMKK